MPPKILSSGRIGISQNMMPLSSALVSHTTIQAPHPVAQAARAAEVEIISEVEFGLRTGKWGRFVVITGTNGKSTTTALTAHLLKTGGAKVAVGGKFRHALMCLK